MTVINNLTKLMPETHTRVWISLEDTKARTLKAELTETHNVSGKISRTPTVMYSCTETGSLPSEGV